MQTLPPSANPFALMLDPAAIFAKLERSQRLEALERRVCRPLDKPLLGGAEDGSDAEDGHINADNGADNDGAAAAGRPGCNDGFI